MENPSDLLAVETPTLPDYPGQGDEREDHGLGDDALAQAWEAAAAEALSFITPEMWARLEDDAYTLHGMLNWAESENRERVATLSRAFAMMRELLKRRPAEFGGPMEVR